MTAVFALALAVNSRVSMAQTADVSAKTDQELAQNSATLSKKLLKRLELLERQNAELRERVGRLESEKVIAVTPKNINGVAGPQLRASTRLMTGSTAAISPAAANTYAADLPVKAPVAIAAPYNWTGFYLGGHVGAGFSTKEWTAVTPFNGVTLPGPITNFNVNGFLGGGQLGYNYQIDRVVLGVEADASWADLSGGDLCPLNSFSNPTCHSKVESFGTISGRLGGTVDRALLYLKGGAAWAHDVHNFRVIDFDFGSPSGTQWGWMVGGRRRVWVYT